MTSRTRGITKNQLLAGLVGLALVVASCGDDDDAGSDTTGAPSASDVATTSTPETTDLAAAVDDESTSATSGWVGVAPSSQPMGEDDAATIDAAATASLGEAVDGGAPGMWIGVWHPDQGVHLAAYGDAVVDAAPATVEDKGRIASITKTFTAAAVLQQVAAGTLSLDDTVADVLPDLAAELPDIADITVEQLLAMQSGIPEFEYRVVQDVIDNPTEIVDLREVIVSTVNEQGLSPVGTASYSTTNYLILGEMLAALTGESIGDVLNGLADDVGLENTALPPADDSEMPPPASAGYVNEFAAAELQAEGVEVEPLGDVSEYTATWGGAGGSMYSNVEDLGTWAATGFGNALLPADLGAQRLESAPIVEGFDYGLGIIDFGNGWYGHTGEILGWNSVAAYQPDTGAIFVGIVNESGSLLATAGPALAVFPDLTGLYGLG